MHELEIDEEEFRTYSRSSVPKPSIDHYIHPQNLSVRWQSARGNFSLTTLCQSQNQR